MVKYEEVFCATRKAFEKREFYELLTGRSGYDVPVLGIPVRVPTDWTEIIPNGVFKLYDESKDEGIIKQYSEAIIRIINGNSTDIWIAANILFNQLSSQQKGKAPFNIKNEILRDFNEALKSKKNEISCNQEYDGNQYSNGLMGDIERLNRILETKYTISMVMKYE